MLEILWITVLVAILLLFVWSAVVKATGFKKVIILEYMRGVKYENGRYVGILGPGAYRIFSKSTTITPVDIRTQFVTIPGQEMLTADGVTVKVTLAASFEVSDPNVATNKVMNAPAAIYLQLQMALREVVASEKIDTVLEGRADISRRIMDKGSKQASELGLKLLSAEVKDLMLPGDVKKVFAQVVKAQKEGLGALERARGESAALRNLANAAKMMEDNPNLLQLRALQVFAESSGNTLNLGIPMEAVGGAKKSE
jgi:regulator of protease activity HflC (stomatin/prohibitin superfamily)